MTTAPRPKKLTVPEFLDWAATQPLGRYELVDGQVLAMAPERARHSLVKGAVYRALGDAVMRARLPCTVFPDGMTVIIDEHHSREPDAAVQCGVEIDLDSMILEAPLVVVEVAPPSSERDDTGDKLVEYFSVASIRHYLIVKPVKAVVIHHERGDQGEIRTRIAKDGDITLNPPGLVLGVKELLGGTS